MFSLCSNVYTTGLSKQVRQRTITAPLERLGSLASQRERQPDHAVLKPQNIRAHAHVRIYVHTASSVILSGLRIQESIMIQRLISTDAH